MEFEHVSVMLAECMEALMPERGGVFVDCTAGGGGHSSEIARRLPAGGRLISLDRDDDAIAACRERLEPYGDRCVIVKSEFSKIASVLDELGIEQIDGVMWDLGVSSHQLDDASRGFSYMSDAPLDMRMDASAPLCAAHVVNRYPEASLARIISDYGEERFAGRIAANIVRAREVSPIETTFQLVDIIKSSIPAASRKKEAQHPAKRTFQAIRIEVNDELGHLREAVEKLPDLLDSGGRIAIITFHSLEDRIVKTEFERRLDPCTCPKEFPVCVCGKVADVKRVTRKPVAPSEEETETNPRARSAKLRVLEKL